MRIIFSRKGFDSGAGGCPSPLIDGRPLSLPIPTKMPSPTRFGDLPGNTGELVEQLTRNRYTRESFCHLDPDLNASVLKRLPAWRGALGQVAAAQGHLRNAHASEGDVFLFWGLFRPVVLDGVWRFEGLPEHRIFGWLQVDAIRAVGSDPQPVLGEFPWLADHPHLREGWPPSSTVYVAREKLRLRGKNVDCPGWGLFPKGVRLTASDKDQVSAWSVPSWLNPKTGGCGMTFHPSERWDPHGYVQAAARGQEFVANVGEREDAMMWLKRLLVDQP